MKRRINSRNKIYYYKPLLKVRNAPVPPRNEHRRRKITKKRGSRHSGLLPESLIKVFITAFL